MIPVLTRHTEAVPLYEAVVAELRLRGFAGDLTVSIPHQGTGTEIGRIADAVQVFKDSLIRMKRLEEETALARAGAEAQRRQAMHEMADGFERAVGGIVGGIAGGGLADAAVDWFLG